MFGEWLEYIKKMAFFLICAQMLIHFRPRGSYVKYLRLLVSLMLLVQVLEPFGRLLGILNDGEFQRYIKEMEGKLSSVQSEVYFSGESAEDIWSKLLKDVEKRVSEETVNSIIPEGEE